MSRPAGLETRGTADLEVCATLNRYAARARGYLLIEMMAYIALFVVVVGFAFKAFYDCWDNAKALRRNGDDIALVLNLGEQWRSEIRKAAGAVQLTDANGTEQLRIPSPAGGITYTFANGEIHRQANATAPDKLWLGNVKSSRMQSDARGPVTAWRWELELKSTRRDPSVRPLFTFECAAGTAATQ